MLDAYDFWAARTPAATAGEIEAMWVRFAKSAAQLADVLGKPPIDHAKLIAPMKTVLGDFEEKLEFDFAPGPAGVHTHTLVLSSGANHADRVLARAVLDNAPDLRGWAFADASPPVDEPTDLDRAIAQRDPAGAFRLTGIEASVGPHRRIALSPQGGGDEKVLTRQAAMAFAALMGEDAGRDWLGPVTCKKRGLLGRIGGRGKSDAGWCADFREECEGLMEEVRGKLPDKPFAEQEYNRATQVMYQANRLEMDPGWRQDTVTGYTNYRQMAQARMMGDPLASARFSRFGESFCGLKVARTPDYKFDEIEQRAALAEGAHLMLSSRGQGGVTGEASGRGHVYVDLAITDLDGGLDTLAELLDKIDLTGPAWLIFDEAGLTHRSVPLTAKTPAEPKPSYA